MKFVRWFMEILMGMILFPVFLLLGLIVGLTKVYRIYHQSIQEQIDK